MITICIPIYNQDVTILVDVLVKQSEATGVPFQILCFDDCSLEKYRVLNKDLGLKFNVNYTELSENLGRSKIRNRMARISRYDFILFLDGDSGIVKDDFVQKYVDLVYKQEVVYGGRIYQNEVPLADELLHWNYGRKVESAPLKKRISKPYQSFLTNNFMVTAKVMHEHPFDEAIAGYGYEDLEWAERLKAKKVFIHHIDNPTIHLGLEKNAIFVEKTEKSIANLVLLHRANKVKGSRLVSFSKKLEEFGISNLFKWWYSAKKQSIRGKLVAGKASLRLFQLYKLGLFLENEDKS